MSDAKCNATNKGLQVVCTSTAQLGEHMRWSRRPTVISFAIAIEFPSSRFFRVHGWSGRVRCPLENRRRRRRRRNSSSSRTATLTDGRPDRKLIRVQGGSSNGVRKTLLFTIHDFPDTFWLYHPLSISQKYFPLNLIVCPSTSVVCTPPSLPSPAAERAFTH